MSPVEIDELKDPIGADPSSSGRRASEKGAVAISLTRYLQLLDWVGRRLRSDKRGAIPSGLAPILNRIGLTGNGLLAQIGQFGSPYDCAARDIIKARHPKRGACLALKPARIADVIGVRDTNTSN